MAVGLFWGSGLADGCCNVMVKRESYALCMQNSEFNEVIVRTLARLPFVPEAASSQPTLVTTNGPVQTFLGGTTRSQCFWFHRRRALCQ
jgi:hypothetical protein